MSDFLGRLAARQVGALTGVAPRLRSRFEPGAIEEGVAMPEPPARLERRDEPDPPADRSTAPPARQEHPAPRAPAHERMVLAEPPATRVDDESEPGEQRAATRVLPAPGSAESRELPRRDRSPAPDESTRAEPARPVPAVTRAIRVARVEEVERRSRPARAPQRSEPLVRMPEPRQAPVPRIVGAPEPPRPAEKAPVVEVTIGRIEVRAVSPPPAAPARRDTSRTAPSLEEYLERRHGAGR